MDFWKSIAGQVEVELTSAEIGAALGAINARGMEILELKQVSDLTCRFRVRRKDYRALAALCEKRGDKLRLLGRKGLYWTGKSLTKRPLLLLGMALFLTAVLYLPSRVFFVRVEGNSTVPTRLILAAAEESGICFGASRREVRSEKMKNALLSAVPQLQWAGVNTSGCVATISVRERTDPEVKEESEEVSSLVAARDGYILSATVTRGNALCYPGQAVKAGQVLVSAYTDCGICIQATRAEGEIYAQTSRSFEAVTPSQWAQKGEVTDVKRKISLLLGKKRINLWKDSGILEGSCGRMYEEYYITLPGGFQLPAALCVEEYTFCEMQTIELTAPEAALSQFAESSLKQQMVTGRILAKCEDVALEDSVYRLTGEYVCTEMIAKVQREQIGDTNG